MPLNEAGVAFLPLIYICVRSERAYIMLMREMLAIAQFLVVIFSFLEPKLLRLFHFMEF